MREGTDSKTADQAVTRGRPSQKEPARDRTEWAYERSLPANAPIFSARIRIGLAARAAGFGLRCRLQEMEPVAYCIAGIDRGEEWAEQRRCFHARLRCDF